MSSILSFDDRNAADFQKITDSITYSLDEIRGDRRRPSTLEYLAKLSGCSVNTLRNREWPITALKEIQEARKKASLSTETPASSAVHKANFRSMEQWKEMLHNQRNQTLKYLISEREAKGMLKLRDDLLASKERLLTDLSQENADLKKEVFRLQSILSKHEIQFSSSPGKITRLRRKKGPDT